MYISDLKQSRLDVALQCGDFKTFNPAETPISSIFSDNKVDVIIETTGSGRAFTDALPYLKKGGKAVMVAELFPGEVPLPLAGLATKELTLTGISRSMMWETWDLMEQLLLENKLNALSIHYSPILTRGF